MRTIVIALFAALIAAPAGAAEKLIDLKKAPGLDKVEGNCGACHSLDYIQMNSPYPSATLWDAEVTKMIKVFGAPITDADAASIKEYLTLLEGLHKQVIAPSIDEFYLLARTVLVKDESNFDKFDRVFGEFFNGLTPPEGVGDGIEAEIPLEWLLKLAQKELSEQDKALVESLGGWEALMQTLRQRLAELTGLNGEALHQLAATPSPASTPPGASRAISASRRTTSAKPRPMNRLTETMVLAGSLAWCGKASCPIWRPPPGR